MQENSVFDGAQDEYEERFMETKPGAEERFQRNEDEAMSEVAATEQAVEAEADGIGFMGRDQDGTAVYIGDTVEFTDNLGLVKDESVGTRHIVSGEYSPQSIMDVIVQGELEERGGKDIAMLDDGECAIPLNCTRKVS